MVVAYIDEAGNDGVSPVFAMGTILLSHSSSYYFGNDWKTLLKKFGLREFHATDLHGRRDELRWDEKGRLAFIDGVVELFNKWEVKHSAVLVPNTEYQQSFVETGFHRTIRPAISKWKKPYLHAFMGTTLALRECADHQQRGVYITPIFDRCQEFMGQALSDYRDRNKDGKLGNMQVSDSRAHVQLQAADFITWEYRVNAEAYVRTGKYEVGPTLASLLQHGFGAKAWRFEDLEYLRLRVEAVQADIDPDSIPEPLAYATRKQNRSIL
ncbi:MAG: DUF3800 domain-containing protein [Bryobacteraceae bacterium]